MNVSKRVARGLDWLTRKGAGHGLSVADAAANADRIDVSTATMCVVGWASGRVTPFNRADAYERLFGVKGRGWMWRHGFEKRRDEDHAVYDDLDAEWRRALRPDLADA